MVVHNTGKNPAYFVLGPALEHFSQVDMTAYDRDSLCEFVPSEGTLEYLQALIRITMRAEIGRALTGEVEAKRLAKNKKEQTGAATFSKVLKVIRPTLESFFREEDQRESLLKTFETTPVPLTDGPFVGQLIKQAFPFSVRILEFVKERYIEILQLREPIPPGGYRLVRVDSRSRLEREEGPTTTGGTDLVVEAPLQGIPAIFLS